MKPSFQTRRQTFKQNRKFSFTCWNCSETSKKYMKKKLEYFENNQADVLFRENLIFRLLVSFCYCRHYKLFFAWWNWEKQDETNFFWCRVVFDVDTLNFQFICRKLCKFQCTLVAVCGKSFDKLTSCIVLFKFFSRIFLLKISLKNLLNPIALIKFLYFIHCRSFNCERQFF